MKIPPKKNRVIVVGAAWYGDCVKNTYRAFLRLGFRTNIVYINSLPAPFGGNKASVTSFFEQTKGKVRKLSPQLFSFLKKVRARISDLELLFRIRVARMKGERVLVIFVWHPGSLWIHKKIKQAGIHGAVLWLHEPPIRDSRWNKTYDYFDQIFIIDEGPFWTGELPLDQRARARLLPLATDETLFAPLTAPAEKYCAQVAYVGQYDATRADLLSKLSAHDLRIYGYHWERSFEKHPNLQNCYKGPLPSEALNLVYGSTAVVIGTIGGATGAEKDPHVTATQRTFDISLAGGFQISQNVSLTKKLFGDSIVYFETGDELAALVVYYLSHEEERKSKAAKAHAIALQYTYGEAAGKMAESCNFFD